MDAITTLKRSALGAAGLVLAMLLVFIATGIGQESLQSFKTPDLYAQTLLRDPPILRGVVGLDNAFILLYSSCFLLLGLHLARTSGQRTLAVASTTLILVTAVLDLLENMHFLTLVATAQAGSAIPAAEISLQVWESMVKFHVSYVGLFMLGLAMPTTTVPLRVLAFSLKYLQWPLGLLIYAGPELWLKPLVLARLAFFLAGLMVVALADWRQTSGSGAPA